MIFDQYQRYKTVQSLVYAYKKHYNKETVRILEVGANKHKDLGEFLPLEDITYSDSSLPESLPDDPQYILADATNLEHIKDNEYDLVVALDVLEHVHPDKREAFIQETSRVAAWGAILCFPHDHPSVINAERRANEYYRAIFGQPHIWLNEHIENGLPNKTDILNLIKKLPWGCLCFEHGDALLWEDLIKALFFSYQSDTLAAYRDTVDDFYEHSLYSRDVSPINYRIYILTTKDESLREELSGFIEGMFNPGLPERELSFVRRCIDEMDRLFSSESNRAPKLSDRHSNIYFDNGSGFSQDNSIDIVYHGYEFEYEIKLPIGIKNIRYDPIEGCGAIVCSLNVIGNNGAIPCQSINGFSFGDRHIFLTDDPQLLINLDGATEWVRIQAQVLPLAETAWTGIFSDLRTMIHDNRQLNKKSSQSLSELNQSNEKLLQSQFELDQSNEKLLQSQSELKQLNEKLLQSQSELEQLNEKLLQSQSELDQSNEKLSQSQSELDQLKDQISQIRSIQKETANQLELYKEKYNESVQIQRAYLNQYEIIRESTLWRITSPIRIIADILKSPFASLKKKTDEISVQFSLETNQYLNEVLSLSGWMFHYDEKLANVNIRIIAGGNEYSFPVIYGMERRDVSSAYGGNENALYSGFSINLLIKNIRKFNIFLYYDGDFTNNRVFVGKISNPLTDKLHYTISRITGPNIKKALHYVANRRINDVISAISRPTIEIVSKNTMPSVNLYEWMSSNTLPEPVFQDCLNGVCVDIIIPVYNGYDYLEALFGSLPKTRMKYRLIIIDDCSPDPRIKGFLADVIRQSPDHVLIENEKNLGFIQSVNKGFQSSKNNVALINTDVILPEYWLERLIAPLVQNSKIASATPFTNSGTLCGFPQIGSDNPMFLGLSCDEIDSVFRKIKPQYTEIPTGVGFCMGISAEAINDIGLFDAQTFRRGYGEENDWCQRAIEKGYTNVIADNLFVYHNHGGSFLSEEKKRLLEENGRALAAKHPDYNYNVAHFFERDPLEPVRNYAILELCLSMAGRCVLYFDHNIGGGATAYLNKAKHGFLKDGQAVAVIRYDAKSGLYFLFFSYLEYEISYRISPFKELSQILKDFPIAEIYVNNLVTYPDIYETLRVILSLRKTSGARLIYLLHDYFSICPTINLLDGNGDYCGLSESGHCETCLRANKYLGCDTFGSMDQWKSNWREFLSEADRIIAFSIASASLLNKWYPNCFSIEVIPHSVDYLFPVKRKIKPFPHLTIGLLGHLNHHKGLPIIEQMIKSINDRELDVRIVLLGDSDAELDGGCFTAHGKYLPGELPKLSIKYGIDLFFISSIWPETFSYTTEEAMKMRFPVAAFDMGAPAERVSKYDKGLIIENVDADYALDSITQFWKRLSGKPKIATKETTVLFLTDYESFSSRYRAEHFMEQLLFHGISSDYRMVSELKQISAINYDCVVIYRSVKTKALSDFIAYCNQLSISVFYDIDDYIFNYEDIKDLEFLAGDDYRNFDRYSADIYDCMSLCDNFITSTENMKKAIQASFPDAIVTVNRNVASMEMLISSNIEVSLKKETDKVVLGYFSGSKTHNKDFAIIRDALLWLLDKYENLRLHIGGVLDLDSSFNPYKGRISTSSFTDWRNLPGLIASTDINLMPVENTFFHACKSENKWMEAALVKVPTVASLNDELAAVIEDGETGFLCGNHEQWVTVLEALINDPVRRCKIAENAHDRVLERYVTMNSGENICQILKYYMNIKE